MATAAPTTRPPAPARPAPSPGLVVAVLSSVGLVASLCMTLVVPIVPSLPALLDTTTANASWVITSTLLAGAVATPIAGRLGDMVGKRRVLLVTMVLLVVGAVLCAVSSDLVPVLVGRALQGVAVSAVPLGISLMRDALPAERLGSGIALMSATLGIGGGLGLPLSALIVQVADWHALFWTAGALGLAGAVLITVVIPESPERSGGGFDYLGSIGLSIGLVCLLLAVSKGGDWGWGSPLTLGMFAAALVVLLAWGAYELRTTDPVVDLRVTARRPVLLPNLISIPVGVAMFTGMVVYPQLLQAPVSSGYGLGLSLLAAGLVLAPNGVVMMLMSPVTARVSARFGPRTSLQIGLVIIAVAYAGGLVLVTAPWQIAVVISVVGAGVALSYGSLPALIMRAVPTSKTAAANGLNTLMRSLGTSTASAVAAVVLSVMTIQVGGAVLPSLTGLRVTLLIASGCAVVALLVSLAVPVLPAPRDTDEVREALDALGADDDRSGTDDAVGVGVDRSGSAEVLGVGVDRSGSGLLVGAPDGAGAVYGRVVRPHGAPADGARVTLVDLDGRQLAVRTVDADGEFTADAPHGRTVLLIAGAPGTRPAAQHVAPHERHTRHEIVLHDAAPVLAGARSSS